MIGMEYTNTYKFRIYPNKTQIKTIENILYLSHNLYNAMLEQRKMAHQLNKDYYKNLKVSYNTQTIELSELKEEFPEYKNIFPQLEHCLDVFLGFTFTQYLPALSALYIVFLISSPQEASGIKRREYPRTVGN